jgi:hypothetical protein
MTAQANHRLTAFGFMLIYFAAMGSLFVISSPIYEVIGQTLLTFVMLPAVVLGFVLIACARIAHVDLT